MCDYMDYGGHYAKYPRYSDWQGQGQEALGATDGAIDPESL